jgi:hypothetical protein
LGPNKNRLEYGRREKEKENEFYVFENTSNKRIQMQV